MSELNDGRHSHGEGSIYRRKDGRWEARGSIGGVRTSFYGASRRDAYQQLKRAAASGIRPARGSDTVKQYLEGWLEDHGARASTSLAYRAWARNHIFPSIGAIRLTDLEPKHVRAMLRKCIDDGLSPRSAHHIRATLRAALSQAVGDELLMRNVAAIAKDVEQVKKYEPFFLDRHQARTFLAAAAGDRLEALYTVAIAVGLREGEALGLRWDDVDLDAGLIRIRRGLQRVPGEGLKAIETKTARSRRTIRLPQLIAPALRAHRTRQLQERLIAGSRWRDTGYVFTSTIGTPLSASNLISRSFHPLRERAQLPHFRYHDLRHSCASLLLAQGVPARVVMELLGHSNISMTLDTYSHVVPGLMDDAARAMDRALAAN